MRGLGLGLGLARRRLGVLQLSDSPGELRAAIFGPGFLTASIYVEATLDAAFAGTGGLNGEAVAQAELAALLSGTASLAADPGQYVSLEAILAGAGNLSGSMRVEANLEAALGGAASLAATTSAEASLAATLPGLGLLAAELGGNAILEAAGTGTGTLAATMVAVAELAASASGTTLFGATLLAAAEFDAAMPGLGVLEGTLQTRDMPTYYDDFEGAASRLTERQGWSMFRSGATTQAPFVQDGYLKNTGSGDVSYCAFKTGGTVPVSANYVEATVRQPANTAGARVISKGKTTGTTIHYIGWGYTPSGTARQYRVVKVRDGTLTVLGTASGSAAAGDIVRFEVRSSTAALIVNGSSVLSVSLGTHDADSNSVVGLVLDNPGTTIPEWLDDFGCGSL